MKVNEYRMFFLGAENMKVNENNTIFISNILFPYFLCQHILPERPKEHGGQSVTFNPPPIKYAMKSCRTTWDMPAQLYWYFP